MTEMYITGDSHGWLNVKLTSTSQVVALPKYLKVDLLETKNKRDHFTIKEGTYKDKAASVSLKSNGKSWLGTPLPDYGSGVSLIFKKGEECLITPLGKIKAITDDDNPIPNGTHPIQIPDFPHKLGRGYLSQAQLAMTWFYLGSGAAVSNNNDRYLHPGAVSLGCITIEEVSKWDALCEKLLLARESGGLNVGKVTVQD
ncbi:hypothetical protein [Thaumasiovibrio subtropicus]|uniref:hypothetical protein n=1 Tax=Thaumasiovibrio subtropicus TaxID=1891207 RepID=UPI000B35F1E6|nr:hypothetical protein [Thaumasiovibrio subtropicus]